MDDMHLKYFRNEVVKWESHLSSNPGCFMAQCIRLTSNMPNLTVVQWWRCSCSSLEQSVWWWSCIFFLMAGWVRFGFSCYCPWNQHTWYLKNWWTNKYTFSLPFLWGEITHQKFAAVKQKGHQNIHQHIVGDPKKIPFPLFAPGSSDAMWNFSLSQHVIRAHCPLVSRLDKVICRV